jgi:large subunit ribosomal protein L24
MKNKVHVKSGDEVVVINGKYRGKRGKVMEVSPSEGKVIVEGVNIVTKHVKPKKMGEPGGLIKAKARCTRAKFSLFAPSAASRQEPAARSTPKAKRYAPAKNRNAWQNLSKGGT